MFVQFGFKQPLPRMQFNEKIYKKMFHWKKIFKHILEITYYIYHITFSKFKSKASFFHLSLKTFVYKTKIPQTGIFLKLLGE